jgi:aerobic carbon-monoxide dehydrogenase medium subunit
VKPPSFEYHVARSTGEATALLEELGEEGRILAGGQSLVPLMNFRLAQPEHIVDINPIRELSYVRRDNGSLAVGATARQADVEHSEDARRHVPLLHEALKSVAHTTIRHRGTVVGSIAHADPAAELPTVAVALGGTITVTKASGSRTVPAEDFFVGPFETVLEPGELVTEVSFPTARPGSAHGFVEFARRHGDFAIAGAAVNLVFEGRRVTDASVVLFSVGPRPIRAGASEDLLRGQAPDADLVEAAAARAVEGLHPGSDMHGSATYRIRVARTQVRRALTAALDRAQEGATT